MKINLLILGMVSFLFLVSSVLGVEHQWNVTLKPGSWTSKEFNINLITENVTYGRIDGPGPTHIITNLPREWNFNVFGNKITPVIILPEDASGIYDNYIYYDNTDFHLHYIVTVNETEEGGEEEGCNIKRDYIIDYYGSMKPGGKLVFYVRNMSYTPVSCEIRVSSLGVGSINPPQLLTDASGCISPGYCEYDIPPNEGGPLLVRVTIPECGGQSDVRQITLMGTESLPSSIVDALVITAPSEVETKEKFTVLVLSQSDGSSIGGALVKVVGIDTGLRTSMTTDSYGVATFELKDPGEYNIFAEKQNYNSTQVTLTVKKPECPYKCCVDSEYQEKKCKSGYECVDNKCKKKVKKEVVISCPSPKAGERLICKLLDEDNEQIVEDISGELIYGDTTMPIEFTEGVVSLTAPTTSFSITSEETDEYKEGEYSYKYPSRLPLYIGIGVAILILILIIFFLKRKFVRIKPSKREAITEPVEPAKMEVTMSLEELKKRLGQK
ncbi:MAG: carboxypeptidase-like regulatory domain-containing protein [Candidatus Hodarchaeales archaeon]